MEKVSKEAKEKSEAAEAAVLEAREEARKQEEKRKQLEKELQQALGGGTTREHHDQNQVEKTIFSNIQDKIFYAAEHTPICNGRLRGKFGYLANTVASDNVLEGTYNYSEGFHAVTRELLEEYARIRARVQEKLVDNFLGGREWQTRWLRAKEKRLLLCPNCILVITWLGENPIESLMCTLWRRQCL